MTNTQNTNPQKNQYIEAEETIDLREIISRFASKWPWLLASMFLFIAMAWVYLRSTPPSYQSTASVLVLDDKSGGLASELDVFNDLGIGANKSNLFNEIEVLKSRSLLENVVKNLNLNVKISQAQNVLKPDICYYDKAPIQIIAINGKESLYDKSGQFEVIPISNDDFKIYERYNQAGDEIERSLGTQSFGKPFNTWAGKIILKKTALWKDDCFHKTFNVSVYNLDKMINTLQKNIQVETMNKDASVLRLSITGINKSRNNDILNNLITQHEQRAIKEKNLITKNTSKFIAERMQVIEAELSDVEGASETFKSENQLIDVSSDAMMYMTRESEISNALLETNIQIQLADYMLNYMQAIENHNQLLPSNLGIENDGLNAMLHDYNTLVLEHNQLLQSSSEKNPTVVKLKAQIESLQNSIKQSLKNTTKSLNIKLASLEKENQTYENKIANVPEYERQYRSIMRQQKIKETLYIYLLEKREENEIAMASTIGNIKVIDFAYASIHPVSPKKNIIFLAALILGLALPIGVIYFISILDNKVNGIADLEQLNMPIAGVIPKRHGKKSAEDLIIKTTENTQEKNAFEMLRTNISFLLPEKTAHKGQMIFVSSTIPEEGKTYISINLGHELTINQQKVLIIGLDLRAPKIAQYLNMPSNKGVTDYVINKNLNINDITIPSEENENLSYIISGSIPPNPAEIIMNKRLMELIHAAKEKFDYIIVDNPPLGMIVDTLQIIHHADLLLYVIRDRFINKKALELPERLLRDKKVKNIASVLNYAQLTKSSYGNYGYRYGYGYGYGYGDGEKENQNKMKQILRWRKK